MTIERMPAYAQDYRYIVYRHAEGKRWFYGAYNEFERALKAAESCRGFVYDSEAGNS